MLLIAAAIVIGLSASVKGGGRGLWIFAALALGLLVAAYQVGAATRSSYYYDQTTAFLSIAAMSAALNVLTVLIGLARPLGRPKAE